MNKLSKVLSIFLIAGLIGTGAAFGITGCGNKEEKPEQGTQQPSDTPSQTPSDTPSQTPGGSTSQTPAALENVVVNSTQVEPLLGEITEKKVLVDNANGKVYVMALTPNENGDGRQVVIDANKKSLDGTDYTHRMKLGGAGTKDYRSIGVETKAGATLVFYAMASNGSESRDVQLLGADGTALTVTGKLDDGAMGQVDGATLHKVEYTVTAAGTYYFASVAKGLNVYGVKIIYNS